MKCLYNVPNLIRKNAYIRYQQIKLFENNSYLLIQLETFKTIFLGIILQIFVNHNQTHLLINIFY